MKKIIKFLFNLSVIVFILGLILGTFPQKSQAQPQCDCGPQPRPCIIHPLAESTVTGNVVIQVYICATVVYEMSIYLQPVGNDQIFLGMASQTSANYFELVWNTRSVSNGRYYLKAIAYIGGSITTYSDYVPVYVNNQTPTPTPTSGSTTTKTKTSPTPTPQATPTPETTQTPEDSVTTENGYQTQTTKDNQTIVTSETPKTSIPITTPNPIASPTKDLMTGSEVFSIVNFTLDQDKTLHMKRIEGRLSKTQQKFLVFSGKSYADSQVKISIYSQPLVMTVKADSGGNWNYVLEKPLEPGKHETYIEVTREDKTERSGPYPFTIAQAQASPENPTGSSLNLVDPQKSMVQKYLYAVAGLIVLGTIIVLIIYFIRKRKIAAIKQPPSPTPPTSVQSPSQKPSS